MRPSKINHASQNANDKDWYFDDRVVENTIWLCVQLMKKYKIPIENVIRHWDVTGKICPKYYVEHPEAWEDFRSALRAARAAGNAS